MYESLAPTSLTPQSVIVTKTNEYKIITELMDGKCDSYMKSTDIMCDKMGGSFYYYSTWYVHLPRSTQDSQFNFCILKCHALRVRYLATSAMPYYRANNAVEFVCG